MLPSKLTNTKNQAFYLAQNVISVDKLIEGVRRHVSPCQRQSLPTVQTGVYLFAFPLSLFFSTHFSLHAKFISLLTPRIFKLVRCTQPHLRSSQLERTRLPSKWRLLSRIIHYNTQERMLSVAYVVHFITQVGAV